MPSSLCSSSVRRGASIGPFRRWCGTWLLRRLRGRPSSSARPEQEDGPMSITKGENRVHNDACNLSEMTRQSAVAAATGNQATIRAAEVVHYRACVASAIANNCQSGAFVRALQDLGTGGV